MPVGSTASLSGHVQLHSAGLMSNGRQELLVKLKKGATKTLKILTEVCGDEVLSRVSTCISKQFSREIDSVKDDEPVGSPKSAITDQNIAKIRDMRGFPYTSVIRLLINTTTLKY
ncbi:hypothetical protein TNCV_3520231 [Trichonephila clavipes]|nr:hypothetical protein TNCV_3520231 [Trichonephila clavipes]